MGSRIPRSSSRIKCGTGSGQALDAAKIALRREMRAHGVNNSELARRLGVAENHVRRLVDLDHRSRIDDVERALKAFGKALSIGVEDLPAKQDQGRAQPSR